MKLTMILLLLFSTIPLCLSQPSPDPVLDFDENLLQSGKEYYVLPQPMGRGGLTLAARRNNASCPLDVVQTNQEADNGLPMAFIPVDPNTDYNVIRESTDLNIIFSAGPTTCDQSNVWMLDLYDKELIVTGNGVKGNPGLVTLSNWFKITTYEDGYKVAFCPAVCDHCASVCGDIGIVIDENETRRLGISHVPLKVKFKKAF